MHAQSVQESPRRGIARRVGAAGMALAALLTLGACKATGGGTSVMPLDGGAPVGVFYRPMQTSASTSPAR